MNTTSAHGTYRPQVLKSWKRVDIFWTDKDPNNWNTSKYTNPIYELIEKKNELKTAVFNPKLKTDSDPNSSTPKSKPAALLAQSTNESTTKSPLDIIIEEANHLKKNKKAAGVVCSSISQWIIIEIETYEPIIPERYDTYPNLHVWGFLQPLYIGNSARMDKERGYVVDDIPRGGWFEAKLQWNNILKRDIIITGYNKTDEKIQYAPKYWRIDPLTKMEKDIIECKQGDREPIQNKIFHRLVDMKNVTWKGSQCQGSYKIQIKICATIRNDETAGDRRRKNQLLLGSIEDKVRKKMGFTSREELKKTKPKTPEEAKRRNDEAQKVREILQNVERCEGGSYIKLWARNLDWAWGESVREAMVEDDESERNMLWMDTHDPRPVGQQGEKEFRNFSGRNHIWKRNRITLVNGNETPSNELVTILLLPTELIDILKLLSQKPSEDSVISKKVNIGEPNVAFSSAVVAGYFIGLLFLYKAKQSILADKVNGKERASLFQKLLDMFQIPKHAALVASCSPPSKNDINPWASFAQKVKYHKFEEALKNEWPFHDKVQLTEEQAFFKATYLIFDMTYKLLFKRTGEAYSKFLKDYKAEKDWKDNLAINLGFKPKFEVGSSPEKQLGFKAEIFSNEHKAKLGGGALPGAAAFLMWEMYSKIGYGGSVGCNANVKEVIKQSGTKTTTYEYTVTMSLSGALEFVLELGAVWSMLELDVFFAGDLGGAENKNLRDIKEGMKSKAQSLWVWQEFFSSILAWVELKAGVNLSTNATGSLGVIISIEYDNFGKKISKFSLVLDPKTGLKPMVSGEFYFILSKLFCYRPTFLESAIFNFNQSGFSILPEGISLFGRDIVKRDMGWGWQWGKQPDIQALKIIDKTEFVMGSKDILVKALFPKETVPNPDDYWMNLNWYMDSIGEVTIFNDIVDRQQNENNVLFTGELKYNLQNLVKVDSPHRAFFKRLLNEGDQNCTPNAYLLSNPEKQKVIFESNFIKSIVIKKPTIIQVKIENIIKEQITSKSKVKISFSIANWLLDKKVYFWFYEAKIFGSSPCAYKSNNGGFPIGPKKFDFASKTAYFEFSPSLGDFNIGNQHNLRPLTGNKATLTARVSLDMQPEESDLFFKFTLGGIEKILDTIPIV